MVRTLWLVASLAVVASANAHPLAPSLLSLVEHANGRADVVWKVPVARPPGSAPSPELPARCRDVTPRAVDAEGAGIVTRWTSDCGADPLVGEAVTVRAIDPAGAVVRVTLRDGRVVQRLLLPSAPSLVIPPADGLFDTAASYVRLGVGHILGGPDHLLFVFGLVLLAGRFRRVVGTVTAFTLGHSLTLAAAVLGLVALPQPPIEVAIAASVFVLAVELARPAEPPSLMRRRPWAMAAVFGLLHGLGFAAALTDAGLARADVPLALFGFNVGIELAQIAFVATVLGLRALLGSTIARLPAWGRHVPVYAMGSLAAFWWLERTVALFR